MTRRVVAMALSAMLAFGLFGSLFHARKLVRRSGYIVASS